MAALKPSARFGWKAMFPWAAGLSFWGLEFTVMFVGLITRHWYGYVLASLILSFLLFLLIYPSVMTRRMLKQIRRGDFSASADRAWQGEPPCDT